MNNLLVWKLQPENSAWRADGLGGIHYNILLSKDSAEGLICLPSGQVFIAAIDNPEITTIDDLKHYLQAHHNRDCSIRDAAAKFIIDEVKKAQADEVKQKRIIIP